MADGTKGGPKGSGSSRDERKRETGHSDFAQDIQGTNRLQGDDQANVRNERGTMPEETADTEGVVESFEKMDPRKRAGKSPL